MPSRGTIDVSCTRKQADRHAGRSLRGNWIFPFFPNHRVGDGLCAVLGHHRRAMHPKASGPAHRPVPTRGTAVYWIPISPAFSNSLYIFRNPVDNVALKCYSNFINQKGDRFDGTQCFLLRILLLLLSQLKVEVICDAQKSKRAAE